MLIDCRCEQSVLSLQVDELNGPALQLYRGLGYEVAAAEARQHRWERTLFMRPAVNRWSAGSARPPRRRGGGLAPPLLLQVASSRAHPCSPRDPLRYGLVSKLLLGGVRERTLLVLQKPRPPAAAEAAEPEAPRGRGVVGRLLSGVRRRLKALR